MSCTRALTVTGLVRYWLASASISTGIVALKSRVWWPGFRDCMISAVQEMDSGARILSIPSMKQHER